MATRRRHTPEQVVRDSAQADRLLGEGKDVADVCRELQVSRADVLPVAQPVRWAQGRGREAVEGAGAGERDLEAAVGRGGAGEGGAEGDLPGKLLSPARRRAAVHHLMDTMGVSERFACRVTGQNRGIQRHEVLDQSPADPDAALRSWLCGYAKKHPRWGFRRAYHDARGQGWTVNHKKVQRLWREEGLRVPQRRRRKSLGTSTTAST